MYLCVVASLVAIPLLILSSGGDRVTRVTLSGLSGAHASGVLFVIALVGTTPLVRAWLTAVTALGRNRRRSPHADNQDLHEALVVHAQGRSRARRSE